MLGKVVYWIAVLAISLVLVVLLILWFESRDGSQLEQARATATKLERASAMPEPLAAVARHRSSRAPEGAEPERFG